MDPDQAEPAAARSGAGQDVRLHAADLHLHVRHFPGGAGDLLRLEQSSVGGAAGFHHEARRRGHKILRQYQTEETEMTEADSGAAEEAARKLFAGPCDFVLGATSAENLPPERLTEVAFVGRSNAGKSSLVNALTGRKSL